MNVDCSRSVRQKGRQTSLQYGLMRADNELNYYLKSGPPVVRVHEACYRDYTNKRRYGETETQGSVKVKLLRLSVNTSSFKLNSFLSGKPAANCRHPDRSQVSGVCITGMHAMMQVYWPCVSSDKISGHLK